MKNVTFFFAFILPWIICNALKYPTCDYPLPSSQEPRIHVVGLVPTDSGARSIENFSFLFMQLHCALKEHYKEVQFDVWRPSSSICTKYNSSNAVKNLKLGAQHARGKPAESRTLCDILKAAAQCAKDYEIIDTLHIVVGLNTLDKVGDCDIKDSFDFKNFHLTVFWIHHADLVPAIDMDNVDYAIIDDAREMTPSIDWLPSNYTLHNFRVAVAENPDNHLIHHLYDRILRLYKQIKSVDFVDTLPIRHSRDLEVTILPPQNTSTAMTWTSTNTAVTGPSTNATIELVPLEIKEVVGDPMNDTKSTNATGFLPNPYSDVVLETSSTTSSPSISSSTTPEKTTPSSNSSVTTPTSTTNETSTATTSNPSESPISSTNASTSGDPSSLKTTTVERGPFGEKENTFLYVIFIILTCLVVACGIAFFVYCLWPKYYHESPHSRMKKKKKKISPDAEVGAPLAIVGSKKQSHSSDSGEKQTLLQSSKATAASKKETKSEAKRPPASMIKPLPEKSPSSKEKLGKKTTPPKISDSHGVASPPSNNNAFGDAFPVLVDSPAVVTPAPSVLSAIEEPKMKFNDGKPKNAAVPELRPV